MTLTRRQFDVLETLAVSRTMMTQRELEKATKHSLGTINKALKELAELGYVENGAITNAGVNALEPYRAKRAIFIAAGFGSRFLLHSTPLSRWSVFMAFVLLTI